ncbi:hypothetical protein HDV00_007034 [Rhizophlyctis rosea]|nr:hypothetical protein HDV00_007034 [Rhizophlyctis rosea]
MPCHSPNVTDNSPVDPLSIFPVEIWAPILARTPSPLNVITTNKSLYRTIYKNERNWSLYLRHRFGSALPVFLDCPKLRNALTPKVLASLLSYNPILPRLSVQRVVKESAELDPRAVAIILAQGTALYGTRLDQNGDDILKFGRSTQQLKQHPNDPLLIRVLSTHVNTYKFFPTPDTDLVHIVAECLSTCSNPMLDILNTIRNNGLWEPEIQPTLNGYTSLAVLERLRGIYAQNGDNLSAFTTSLDWLYTHHFLTIPDSYFQNPPIPQWSDPEKDRWTNKTSVIETFKRVRSQEDWQGQVAFQALNAARFFTSSLHQEQLLEWFTSHGFPVTVKGLELYLNHVLGIHDSLLKEKQPYAAAIEKDWDFLSRNVCRELLNSMAGLPLRWAPANGERRGKGRDGDRVW